MATDYPIEITDPDGSVRIAGLADFIDSDNAPGGLPLVIPTGSGTTVVLEIEDGPPLQSYDADTGTMLFVAVVDTADGFGPSAAYVTVQSGPPSTYLTPLVFDSTAVTGGLYAWDGSAYQNVGGPL